MKKGGKKSPITKEQLYQQQESAYKKQFIKDKFYPALVGATVSVDEASMLLQAMTSLVMEEAMETLRSKKMSEIRNRIVKKLTSDGDRVVAVEHLIGLFDKQTLFDARSNFEGMKAVIEQMKIDEMQSRSLSTMKVDWDRYLSK